MERLAAPAKHATPSNRRMGPAAVWPGCSCRTAPRRPRRHVAVDRPRSCRAEAGVAHRTAGSTHWFAGEFREAQEHLEHALALFQPGRDDDLAFRFGQDPGVAAMLYLALTLWPLGDIGRAVSLVC